MVKINKTLGLALLTALAASCSSDNDVAQAPEPVNNNGSAAYATLRIDLPTQQGSRAVSTFEDGLTGEYKVNDATLLVFKKGSKDATEKDYTFVEKVTLTLPTSWTEQKDNGITTTGTIVAKLTKSSLADARQGNYYGLVILNNKDNDDKDKVTLPGENATTTTYSAFNVAINTDAAKMQENGFFMANAPEWTAYDAEPLTLVHFDGSKIYTTQDQASKGDAAATFHVERGLAKVTIADASKSPSISGSAHTGDDVSISGWQLDVTNKSSFPIHNVYGLKDSYPDIWNEDASATQVPTVNRFHDMTNSFKRVYWGIDPNYNSETNLNKVTSLDACHKAFNIATNGDNIQTTFGNDNPQYCLENTFDIDNMTQGQTTRVLFQATYTPSGMNAGDTFFKVGTKMYTQENLETLINNIAKTVDANYATNYTLNLGTIASTAGEVPLTKDNFKAKEGVTPKVKAEDLAAKVNELLNSKIATYYEGVCYYIGRIQHFGDVETPWNPGESYGTDNQKYLGRYGVLRNNWYDLKVNSVTGPGVPTPPEVIPENPDDENNVYVNMTVKILQWAKHSTQNLVL